MGSQQPSQRLTNGTELSLTTPLNSVTQERFTDSIQSTNRLTRRYDYVLPNRLLLASVESSEVFRSELKGRTYLVVDGTTDLLREITDSRQDSEHAKESLD